MATRAQIRDLFDRTWDRYTYGHACVLAASDVQRWLYSRGLVAGPTRTAFVCYEVVPSYPVCTLNGSVPDHAFRVCTRAYELTDECIWIPRPALRPIVVRFAAAHEVMPVFLEDVECEVLVDLSARQFRIPPAGRVQLYT